MPASTTRIMDPRERPARRHALGLGLMLALLAVTEAGPAEGQIFHRPRCSRPDCPPEHFRLDVERMTLTEGPMASDRDQRDLQEMKERIQRELEGDPDNPVLWLALSEAEFGLGDPVPAMTAATRALELGADSSLALRARAAARMRMPGGEFEGATLYLQALDRMTRYARPRFMADVMPLLTQVELDWWRSADLETLRPWIRGYWEHRAALAGVRVEDRLAEHMRRMAMASRLYAPPGTGSGAAGYADVLLSPELNMLPFDDRGLVYVRRGPPLDEMQVPVSDMFSDLPSITWLYGNVEGPVDVFHFARGGWGGSGYRLVTAPPCDPTYQSGRTGSLSAVSDGWVVDAAAVTAEATPPAVSCFGGDWRTLQANARMNALEMRRQTMRALSAESPREPFLRPLPAFFDHYMFRGPDNTTQVVTPVVVPVADNATQPIELLVTFVNQGGGVVRREATSSTAQAQVQRSIESDGEGWGVAYAQTTVAPWADAAYRVVVRDPTDPTRGGMWGGTVAVRSFAGYGVKMSDLVVAAAGPSTWVRDGTRLFLLPRRAFEPGGDALVFYEIYDLEPGATYTTELTLRPEDENLRQRLWRSIAGSPEVRIRFESQVPENAGSTLQELRTVGLPDPEGRYTLTVRISGPRGQVAESTREVIISRDAATAASGPTVGGGNATQGSE